MNTVDVLIHYYIQVNTVPKLNILTTLTALCGSILLKSVELASGKTILYPFMVYCYKSLKHSLQNLLLNKEFYSIVNFGITEQWKIIA